MIKDVMVEIGGVGVFAIVSLIIFFALFAGVLGRVMRLKKSYLERMKELPLNPDEQSIDTGPQSHD